MELVSAWLSDLLAQPRWVIFLAVLGLLSAARFAAARLHWLYVCFLRPPKNLSKYGSWAVVTGATDGIGKSFAFHFARKNLNLVLVGRSPDKLKTVSDAIRAESGGTTVKTVIIDFAGDRLADGVERLREAIAGLDVGVVVNNVGVCYPYARYFHEVDEELIRSHVRVNVEGVTRVTQAVLPGMLERRRGAIVNIGSGASIVIPCDPLYSLYAATKAYVDQFSRGLYVEYKNKGIDVQCQVPLYVATKMTAITKTSFFVPSPDTYVRSALRWIGYEPRCTPYWPHSFLWGVISMFPESIIDKERLNFGLGVRKRGQLKDAGKKSQ